MILLATVPSMRYATLITPTPGVSMAFATTIHPLSSPRLIAPDDWADTSGTGNVALSNGASLILRDWQPSTLYMSVDGDPAAVLRDAEAVSGCWLEAGRWSKPAHGMRKRMVKLTRLQPDVRLTFHPDEGPAQYWLLLVDDGGLPPGSLVTWTHAEWYSKDCWDGGAWSMQDGIWMLDGKTTPGGASGVLTADLLNDRVGDA